MNSIRIDVSGAEQAAKMFGDVAMTVEELKIKLPILTSEIIIYEARNNLQNNTSIVSADLHASLGILEKHDDGITVGTTLPYAKYVEYGRGPITAGEGKVLHFFTKDGQEIFTKSVGPAEPRPFFWPAVHVGLRHMKQMVADLINKA